MGSGNWFQRARIVTLALVLSGVTVQLAHAIGFTFQEDINKFGLQNNFQG